MNGFDTGAGFGYDQITPNMQLDSYDAPYILRPGDVQNRTMQTPPIAPREPVASYYEAARRPYHSPDSSLIGREPGKCGLESGGIPGPLGKALDCGCGCRGAKKIAALKNAKDNFMTGSVELDNMHMFFIALLALIVIMNAINVKYLTKQIKLLSRAAAQRIGPAAQTGSSQQSPLSTPA